MRRIGKIFTVPFNFINAINPPSFLTRRPVVHSSYRLDTDFMVITGRLLFKYRAAARPRERRRYANNSLLHKLKKFRSGVYLLAITRRARAHKGVPAVSARSREFARSLFDRLRYGDGAKFRRRRRRSKFPDVCRNTLKAVRRRLNQFIIQVLGDTPASACLPACVRTPRRGVNSPGEAQRGQRRAARDVSQPATLPNEKFNRTAPLLTRAGRGSSAAAALRIYIFCVLRLITQRAFDNTSPAHGVQKTTKAQSSAREGSAPERQAGRRARGGRSRGARSGTGSRYADTRVHTSTVCALCSVARPVLRKRPRERYDDKQTRTYRTNSLVEAERDHVFPGVNELLDDSERFGGARVNHL
ncbi:hypothetical protein EVAR_67576_1 [Eumeta japonica]|uniref:Uncharacterized protein n=1 Tax=Eumeta variegata TaxID=151549 RepID=A0A4C2A7M5_EUMVA|nr:hypothetical protein EVAR_67576_1 [Eumeta japonica]